MQSIIEGIKVHLLSPAEKNRLATSKEILVFYSLPIHNVKGMKPIAKHKQKDFAQKPPKAIVSKSRRKKCYSFSNTGSHTYKSWVLT
tara:strand:+ start:235 stop:495 length:261 start_codon:yes stop_codon:yes gene_type:complete